METIRSFRVDEDLLKRIKILCIKKNMTIMEFVKRALTKYYQELSKS